MQGVLSDYPYFVRESVAAWQAVSKIERSFFFEGLPRQAGHACMCGVNVLAHAAIRIVEYANFGRN